MKKYILITGALLVLGTGAWFSFRKASRRSTLEKLDLNFSVTDTASIDRILIEPVGGKHADLRRTENQGWILNGKYRVAPVLMDVLLTTIRNVEMLRSLSPGEAQTALESFQKRGRKVQIFVNGSLYKSYLLGDDAPANKGTYMQLENGDPYVAYLRGFNGFLSPRYDVRENDWRDHLLLSCSPEQIQEIKLSYKRFPQENVHLAFTGKKLQLIGSTRFDTAAAMRIFNSFRQVYFEKVLVGIPQKALDSLRNTGSEYSIEISSSAEACSRTLQLYFTNDEGRSIAFIPQTNEWFTIQNQNLTPILQRKSSLIY